MDKDKFLNALLDSVTATMQELADNGNANMRYVLALGKLSMKLSDLSNKDLEDSVKGQHTVSEDKQDRISTICERALMSIENILNDED